MKLILTALRMFSLFVLLSLTTYPQISETLNYQGYLIDSDGATYPDGTYNMTFSIYDEFGAAIPLWTEDVEIQTKMGFFNTYLGLRNPFDSAGLKFDKTYWLGIRLGSDNEFSPRTQLSVSPYSFTAKKLEFPYLDSIKTSDGILLIKANQGPVFEIRTKYGLGASFINTYDNSANPTVWIQDSSRGYSLLSDAQGFRTAAAYFTTSNNGNRRPTVEVVNYGLGNAFYAANENKADTMPVISILNQSQGYAQLIQTLSTYTNKPAILLNAMGNGGGADYRILKTDNIQSVFTANTWGLGVPGIFKINNNLNNNAVIQSTTIGTGPAAVFRISNATSDTMALYSLTNGTGSAGKFEVLNSSNINPSLIVTSNGTGPSLYSKAVGTGRAAYFESNNSTENPTLYTISNSKHSAIFATNVSNGSSAEFIIDSDNDTDGPNVLIDHKGGGVSLKVHSGTNPLHPALYVRKEGIGGISAIFDGHMMVNGELQKLSGSFVIDHPLDPANKLLAHSFVESPDMKNIYDGVVTLDSRGEATVTLPSWFGTLNKDFRYQLTCIGGWAQVYISEEIRDNKFRISGGKPGLKISWMVTGIRQDPWAEQHRIQVERDKPANQIGKYLFEEYYTK